MPRATILKNQVGHFYALRVGHSYALISTLVMEAGELAKKKNLGLAAGTHRRHQKSYIETINRIKDGAIDDIIYVKAY